MQGNDLDNRPQYRYYVISDVVFHEREVTTQEKSWLRTRTVTRTLLMPDIAALSFLWRWAEKQRARLEIVFVGEAALNASELFDDLDDTAANPFNDWHVFESVDDIVRGLPYRPDILGYIDIPSRSAYYGGRGMTLESLR